MPRSNAGAAKALVAIIALAIGLAIVNGMCQRLEQEQLPQVIPPPQRDFLHTFPPPLEPPRLPEHWHPGSREAPRRERRDG